ncbi:NAD(P)-binding protein [Mytilinidion resinicola]|uniref:NAD(P)-binding protein n=1 Tax=Mytilinidion resinicola TaxID=574789 RepID=A0A6A6Z5L1_9PEZI|nr:NAD(P)-binding protein [Mytilinidion resinicola]KAF2816118.1 NAD(P)-binding protein [Mytilinidion resinicola]
MPNVLIVGATRGLGAAVAKQYTSIGHHVYATARSSNPPSDDKNLSYIPSIDLSTPDAGPNLIKYLEAHSITSLDIIVVTAGYFVTETFEEPSFDKQLAMYKTCAIGPTLLVSALGNYTPSSTSKPLLSQGTKVILVSSEGGSIKLVYDGGGNYGHHASKAALNMSGKLLSVDLKDRGVAVGIVHPGFMRTDMTKGVGFDKFWDSGGAVTPDVAAESLVEWIKTFTIEHTGEFWAPRGAADIGSAEAVLGPKDKLPIPLQLPW